MRRLSLQLTCQRTLTVTKIMCAFYPQGSGPQSPCSNRKVLGREGLGVEVGCGGRVGDSGTVRASSLQCHHSCWYSFFPWTKQAERVCQPTASALRANSLKQNPQIRPAFFQWLSETSEPCQKLLLARNLRKLLYTGHTL